MVANSLINFFHSFFLVTHAKKWLQNNVIMFRLFYNAKSCDSCGNILSVLSPVLMERGTATRMIRDIDTVYWQTQILTYAWIQFWLPLPQLIFYNLMHFVLFQISLPTSTVVDNELEHEIYSGVYSLLTPICIWVGLYREKKNSELLESSSGKSHKWPTNHDVLVVENQMATESFCQIDWLCIWMDHIRGIPVSHRRRVAKFIPIHFANRKSIIKWMMRTVAKCP